jgi:uncharacterized YigZ family protein
MILVNWVKMSTFSQVGPAFLIMDCMNAYKSRYVCDKLVSMDSPLYIPRGTSEKELIEKRSRFIGKAEGISSPVEARAEIARRKEEHAASSHVAYAFIVGPPKSRTMGMSDDGEPKGTAGKPVLEILKGSGITNVLLTIVRYFGGTKLGTGGLVRAYSGTAKITLAELKTAVFETRFQFRLSLPYELFDPVKRIILECRGSLLEEDFATAVDITGEISENMVKLLRTRVRDISNGLLEPQFLNGENGG